MNWARQDLSCFATRVQRAIPTIFPKTHPRLQAFLCILKIQPFYHFLRTVGSVVFMPFVFAAAAALGFDSLEFRVR